MCASRIRVLLLPPHTHTASVMWHMNVHLPLLVLWWHIAVTQSEEQSLSRHYSSKFCYSHCSMCSHRSFRNGGIITSGSSNGQAPITVICPPLKHKCCGSRRVQVIVHNADETEALSSLILLAGDVERNPGPGTVK